MRGIRFSDRMLIAGQTQKGKTTLARYLVGRLQPVRTVVFDPKDEMTFPGAEKCRTPDQLQAHLADPLIHYVPSGFDRDQLEDACEVVWTGLPGPYIWWIDETSEVSSPNWCPAGLRLGVTQGAKERKLIIALTQRMAEIHPVFRSQANHIIIFTPAPVELDLKAVAGNVRREARVLKDELELLHDEYGDYSHLWYVQDGDELRRCAPLPIGADGREPAAGRGQLGKPSTAPDSDEVESGVCEEPDSSSGRS